MKVVNPSLIASYRTPGPCRYCGKVVRMRCAAHIFSRGAGQVDIPCNLVSLGMDAVTDCDCHARSHGGNEPTTDELLAVSAADHGCLQGDIEELVWLIRRLDKTCSEAGYLRAVKELNFSARRLAMREYESFRGVVWNKRRSAG
jgi:hypothetical protein